MGYDLTARGGTRYSLTLGGENKDLVFTVMESAKTRLRGNLLGNGHSQIAAFGSRKNLAQSTSAPVDGSSSGIEFFRTAAPVTADSIVGYVANAGEPAPAWVGTWEWSGNDAAIWQVVGVGRFAGSEVDHDGLLLYNTGNSTYAAWTDLNDPSYGYVSLCYTGADFSIECLGDFDGNGFDDLVLCGSSGSVGIVSDGTVYHDVWHVDANDSTDWVLLGTGRFNGTSDSLLFRNLSNDHLYLWDNQDPTYATWNWTQTDIGYVEDGWEFVALGDFSGDGVDDIVLINPNDNNAVFIRDNGVQSTQRYAGVLESGFQFEGVGNFDGDGKEDLLLREYNTGWGGLGYWSAASANGWTDMQARVETDRGSSLTIAIA